MFHIIQNIVLGISLAAPIGPANVAIIKKGLDQGFSSGLLVGLGVITADTVYLLGIYFGLSSLINIPTIKILIWLLGSVILLFLGYRGIRDYFGKTDLKKHKKIFYRNSFTEGFMINIANPITIVWWSGVFGSVLGIYAQNILKIKILLNSFTIIIGVLLWVFTISLLTRWGKKFINERNVKFVSLVAGFVLIGFGIYFGYNAFVSII